MKLILKVSAVACCSLIAVMRTPVTQAEVKTALTTAPGPQLAIDGAQPILNAITPFERIDYNESSVLAVSQDGVFIGDGSFELAGLKLDVLVTFENDTFNFKYTATNISERPLYWTGSKETCGLKNYHVTINAYSEHTFADSTDLDYKYGKVFHDPDRMASEIENAQQMLMVAGEQRIIECKIDASYFRGFERKQISNLRWWSIVPLPGQTPADMCHEYGDIYGSWNDRGKFSLKFEAPFWDNTSEVAKPGTALANKVMLGKHTEMIDGLQFYSELHYDAGKVVEKIIVTNVSGGGLYWPRNMKSRKPYASLSYTIDKNRIKSWQENDDWLVIGGGCGGRYGTRGRHGKPTAADLDSWFIAPDESVEFNVSNNLDISNFRRQVYSYSRDAIRGISSVDGAHHLFHVALNYPPEFYPNSSKWKKKSFFASFDKDDGYSHILCEE